MTDTQELNEDLTNEQKKEVEAEGSGGCYTAYESSLGWLDTED